MFQRKEVDDVLEDGDRKGLDIADGACGLQNDFEALARY